MVLLQEQGGTYKVNLLRSQNQLKQKKLNLENTINQAYNNAGGL